jgi:hypothetical protein
MAARTGRIQGLARTSLLTAIAAGTLLTLTGCLSITSDLTINADATGSGTFTLGLQKQAASLMGMSDLKSFSSGITQQDMAKSESNLLASGDCKASETSTEFVYTCTFKDAAFTKEDELWTIKKVGNEIVFSMKNAGSSGADAGQMADLLGGSSLGDITVNVTFPGPIQQVSGTGATKTSDTTATVKGAMTDQFDVSITSAASSRPPIGLIIGAAVALLLLLAIIVVLVLFLVRRGKKSSTALPAGADADQALADYVPAMPGAAGAAAVAATSAAIALPGETVTDTAVVEIVTEEAAAPIVIEDAGPAAEPPVPPAT